MKPYNERGGGLITSPLLGAPAIEYDSTGPSVSWLHKCIVGDDQGADGACVIFALASWSEIMTGRAISNDTCLSIYQDVLKRYKRPQGSGMTFIEGYDAAPSDWFPNRGPLRRATMADLATQPLLGGYSVTPAFDNVNPVGCLDHHASNRSRGGHAVVVSAAGVLPHLSGEFVWIENSWGLSWGHNGIGVMRRDLHNRLCSELWMIA